MSVASELTLLRNTKAAIKQSIINKGVAVADNDAFATYPSKIDAIETGGSGTTVEYEDYGAAYIMVDDVKHYIPELFDDKKAIAYEPKYAEQSWFNPSSPYGFEAIIFNPEGKIYANVKRNATTNNNDYYTLNGTVVRDSKSTASPSDFNFVEDTGFNDLISRKWWQSWSYNSSTHKTNILLPETASNNNYSLFEKERIYALYASHNESTDKIYDNTNLRVLNMPWQTVNSASTTGSVYNLSKLKAIIANDTKNSVNTVVYNCPELYIFKVNNLGYNSSYSTAYTLDLHYVLNNYIETFDETIESIYYTLTHLFDRKTASSSAKTFTIKFNTCVEQDLDVWINGKYDGDEYPYNNLSELMSDITAKGIAVTFE